MTAATPSSLPLPAAPPNDGAARATAPCARCSSLEAELVQLRAANAQLRARLAGLEHEEDVVLLESQTDQTEGCGDEQPDGTAAPAQSASAMPQSLPYSAFTRVELQRYGRQMLVKEFSAAAQLELRRAKVLVLGVGGLGSPVAMYLAAMGVGTLGLVDSDEVERSNLHRQVLHDEQAASHREKKVFSAQRRLRKLNPLVNCVPYATRFTAANALALVDAYDVVVDASDNVGTRYLVNDACARNRKPLVSGSALGLEGQVTVFPFSDEEDAAGCYRCLYPTPPRAAMSCSENGVIGVVPGVIGCLQAMEAVKVITGTGEPLVGVQCFYDAYDGQFRRMKLGKKRNPTCPACGTSASCRDGVAIDAALLSEGGVVCSDGVPSSMELSQEFRISAQEFAKVREASLEARDDEKEDVQRESYVLLDTRARNQFEMTRFPEAVNVPFGQLTRQEDPVQFLEELLDNSKSSTSSSSSCGLLGDQETLLHKRQIFVICRRGVDSVAATRWLVKSGLTNVRNVDGGYTEYAKEGGVDPTFPMY